MNATPGPEHNPDEQIPPAAQDAPRICKVTLGRHDWTTVETTVSVRSEVQHVKYVACRECGGRP